MTHEVSPSLLAILTAPVTKKAQKHPGIVLAEKIEERLFAKNKLRQIKAIYTTDELWDLFRVLFINHFGPCEEARLKAWTYSLKCKGRVQVLNALYELLEERYPEVKFERREAKPKRKE
ncbi:hypothetical protein ACV1C4_07305 [Aeromonas hydrophila]|uniref:hypothetical protein n=1 Tax=Aeromonas dhakensis TaxID=196024 RepID=UPI003BA0D14D